MTCNTAEEPRDWAEVNVLPTSNAKPEVLLLDVADRLIHETLSGRVESWHYFWEHLPIQMHHLRLRVLWRPGEGRDGMAALATYLDEVEAGGRLWRWYPGSHGIPGADYEGEPTSYDGREMWEATYDDWRAGSELALALVKLDAEGGLAERRDFHLERRVHLQSNRLGLSLFDEGQLYLRLAVGYLAHAGLGGTPFGTKVLAALSGINNAIAAAVEPGKASKL
jgi:hypothetical protein